MAYTINIPISFYRPWLQGAFALDDKRVSISMPDGQPVYMQQELESGTKRYGLIPGDEPIELRLEDVRECETKTEVNYGMLTIGLVLLGLAVCVGLIVSAMVPHMVAVHLCFTVFGLIALAVCMSSIRSVFYIKDAYDAICVVEIPNYATGQAEKFCRLIKMAQICTGV